MLYSGNFAYLCFSLIIGIQTPQHQMVVMMMMMMKDLSVKAPPLHPSATKINYGQVKSILVRVLECFPEAEKLS